MIRDFPSIFEDFDGDVAFAFDLDFGFDFVTLFVTFALYNFR